MACHCNDATIDCDHVGKQSGPPRTYTESDGTVPAYLPQPSDYYAKPSKIGEGSEMSPIGPWATGRPIWNPSVDLVGVRPVVDRYSITKYSPLEWRKGNLAVMDMVKDVEGLKENVKCTIDMVTSKSDKMQNDNAIRLTKRFQDIKSYQNQMEALVLDIREEIVLLTEAKVRLKFTLPALKMPESIAGECIDKRTCRIEQDLVKDELDTELVKELALIYETRQIITDLLEQIEKQISANRACKDELENSWSDKKETSEIEAKNASLRNTSSTIIYKHGSTRIQNLQSTPETWEHYCNVLIKTGSQEVKKSRDLRNKIDSDVITKAGKDLGDQASKVMTLLKKRIEETDQCRQAFERQLQAVLMQIAETENLYEGLWKLLRQLDFNLKVAETRLDSRMYRPRTENCRDEAQYGLIDEVKAINNSQSALRKQIAEIDATLAKLYQTRANLEYSIMSKRKTLYIDQQRCMAYREQYPDISTMTSSPV